MPFLVGIVRRYYIILAHTPSLCTIAYQTQMMSNQMSIFKVLGVTGKYFDKDGDANGFFKPYKSSVSFLYEAAPVVTAWRCKDKYWGVC